MEDAIGLICGLLGIVVLVVWIHWPSDGKFGGGLEE